MPLAGVSREASGRGIPWGALGVTIMMQALVTMAAYSISVAAPRVAADLGIPGSRVGLYTSAVYGAGVASAALAAGFIMRFGAMRVGQFCLLCGAAGLAVASAGGTLLAVAASALIIGAGYGAPAPASSHILGSRTRPAIANLVYSLRQTSVPLGGILASLAVPQLLKVTDWRGALAWEIVPILLLLLAVQPMRAGYDSDRDPDRRVFAGGVLAPIRMVAAEPALRWLSVVGFVYSGMQLCFVAFTTVYLTGRVGMDLVHAAAMLAVYQVAGVVSRPIWGWIADVAVPARLLLVAQGFVMAGAAVAAGFFAPGWPTVAIALVFALAGCTASGFTGICYAEFARLAGPGRIAMATSGGAAAMFLGVMVLPSVFSLLVELDGYLAAFATTALVAAGSGVLLWWSPGAGGPARAKT